MSAQPMTSLERVPPHNLEAEESVLGSMILSHRAVAEVQDLLRPEDFYKEAHRKIYQVIIELYAGGSTTDPVVLAEELKSRGMLEAVGDRAYIYSLVDTTPNPSNARHYANIVRDMSIRRNLVDVGYEITDLGYQVGEDVEEMYDRAEGSLFNLGKQMRRQGLSHIKEPLKDSFNRLSDAIERGSSVTGVPTGFYELDRLTGGLQPSNLIVVGGRTSMGKTSFALNVTRHAALREEVGVLIFSLEMSKAEVAERLLLSEAEVESTKYRVGKVGDREMERIVKAAELLSNAPIFIDDTGDITLLEMRTIGRQMKAKENIGLMVVDYIQLLYMGKSEGRRYESRAQEVSKIARDLKVIAMDLGIPVIAVSQLKRQGQKKPTLEDLKESGGIEQSADLVILIYRPEVDDPNPDLRGIADINLAKHRNGQTGDFKVYWKGSHAKFENLVEEKSLPVP